MVLNSYNAGGGGPNASGSHPNRLGLCSGFALRIPTPLRGAITRERSLSLGKASFSSFKLLSLVIRLGFEPKTHSLEGCCSIQLSYRTIPNGTANVRKIAII